MSLTRIILVGLLLRLAVAVWNGFFGPSLGAELDAETFYLTALAGSRHLTFLEWEVGANIYTNLLTVCFYLVNDSLFFGSLLSCLAWLGAAILLMKSVRMLNPEGIWRTLPLWIFALAPTSVLNTGVTLREPFQLLFVNLAIYSAMRIGLTGSKIHWLTFIAGCVGAGYLHGALIGFVILLVPATILFVVAIGRQNLPWGRIILALLAGFALLQFGLTFVSDYGYDLSLGLFEAALRYQEGGLSIDARANYKTLDYSGDLFSTIRSLIVGFLQYLLEPLPWNIGNIVDLGLFFENIVRMWLLYLCYRNIRLSRGSRRITLLYLVGMFLAIELIWSLGTVNWGTGSRHHVPAMGMLVLAASFAPKRKPARNDEGAAMALRYAA